MTIPAVVLPKLYADRLAASGKNSGQIDLKFDEAEQLGVVDGIREGRQGARRQGLSDIPRGMYLGYASTSVGMGLWFRVDADLHLAAISASVRDGAVSLSAFRSLVVGGDWTQPANGAYTLAVTVAAVPEIGEPHFAAWRLLPDRDLAEMVPLEVVDEAPDLLAPLESVWPLKELADKKVVLIGAGSIGGAAAEALAAYGLRNLVLIDPDRLFTHNFARHRVDSQNLGRHKVTALAQRLRDRDGAMDIDPAMLNVIYDADFVRPILREADAVLVCTDGVDSRRVANHLVWRAGKPAIFACVLADGAFGEILRIRPPRTGCLLCARAALIDSGGMNPEPALDRGYGTGTRHLPMTAVGGDLGLVGQLAAKAVVGTLLEDLGYREQRLPGDHAIVGLQPKPGLAPPFDVEFAGELRWHSLPSSRQSCPTCGSVE